MKYIIILGILLSGCSTVPTASPYECVVYLSTGATIKLTVMASNPDDASSVADTVRKRLTEDGHLGDSSAFICYPND